MDGARPVVLVDGMILAYRCNSALGWMATRDGVPTGLRFGVLRALCSYQRKLNASKMIIAWDLKGPIKKAEGVSEYKADRQHNESEKKMFDQLPELRELISATKWQQMWLEGYEADDLIAAALAVTPRPVVIVSTDTDLYQLTDVGVVQWTASSKNDKFITHHDVLNEWKVTPRQLPLLRSMLGDVSDNFKQPLLFGDLRVGFQEFLGFTPEVETADQMHTAWVHADELGEEFWQNLKRREKVMRPMFPDKLPLYEGSRNEEYLLKEFEAMESKTLKEQLFKMI